MTSTTTARSFALVPSLETAWQDVDSSFERFCLTAGIGAIEQMLATLDRRRRRLVLPSAFSKGSTRC
jgi:hypothetical protein